MASQGDGSSSGEKGNRKMEELMKELALGEDDLDDVVFEKEEAPVTEDLRLMIIVTVHMDRDFSTYWFFKNMCTAWDLARCVKI